MIPISLCKDGFLYIIKARNSFLGVYNKQEEGFKISRVKFNANYIFTEYHWDTGEPFGTAKPLKEIGAVPSMTDDELLKYLNEQQIVLRQEILEIRQSALYQEEN